MAIADYLRKLVELKNQLVANLNSMGVAADESEKLNTLVPKVLECEGKQNVEFVKGTDFTGTSGKAGFSTSIKEVNIPDGTTAIGSYAFSGCTRLESITIPDSVANIGDYVFENCSRLTSITIPDSVANIGDYVFENCSRLTSITIPDSVANIGDYVFTNCTSLTSIIIPDTVTSIGIYVFRSCTSLANIYYKGAETQWKAIKKGANWAYSMGSSVSGGTTIHCNYVPE